MNTVDLIILSSTSFYNQLKIDENARYRSWEHCYTHFYYARNNPTTDLDYLSLHLAFYLASWGMYRGSSFLLQKDYRIHIPMIRELLRAKYNPLFGIECVEYRKLDNQNLLGELNTFMEDYYNGVRMSVKEVLPQTGLSHTLITKTLLGSLGCVPAYDRYFISGVKSQNVATGSYNIRSLLMLANFYEKNYVKLEQARTHLRMDEVIYPQMKLLDMGFWQIGFDLSIT